MHPFRSFPPAAAIARERGFRRGQQLQPAARGRDSLTRGGFTLLEVLLTLALIGLLATALVGGGAQLLNPKPVTPDDVFWTAVQEARKMALKSEREVTLRFVGDDKEGGKAFVVTGDTTRTFAVPAPGDLQVTFHAQQKGGNLMLIGGTVVETREVPSVTFYPDGTCSSFRVQFFRNGAAHQTGIDPWTCAPVLTANDADAAKS